MSGKVDIVLEGTDKDLKKNIEDYIESDCLVTFKKHPVKACKMKERGHNPTDAVNIHEHMGWKNLYILAQKNDYIFSTICFTHEKVPRRSADPIEGRKPKC